MSTTYRQCFEALGATLSNAELEALVVLSRRVRDEGCLSLNEERGLALETMLEPSLDGLEAEELTALGESAMRTIGGSVRAFQLLEEEVGGERAGLVPEEYVPIAFQDDGAVFYFLGTRRERRGVVFLMSVEGQDQRISEHGQMEAVGRIEAIANAPSTL
jgi:hypothetical protein